MARIGGQEEWDLAVPSTQLVAEHQVLDQDLQVVEPPAAVAAAQVAEEVLGVLLVGLVAAELLVVPQLGHQLVVPVVFQVAHPAAHQVLEGLVELQAAPRKLIVMAI